MRNKFSIITVNLNNVSGLAATMQSVFNQVFNEYQYIVIDGGSTDGSVHLLEDHKNKLSYRVSESDTGVYNAMNKGIQKATGEYVLFLNSGDFLLDENVLASIAEELNEKDIVYGHILFKDPNGKSWIGVYPDELAFSHFATGSLPHPASFIKRSLFESVGQYDESLIICADWKFFLDAVCKHKVSYRHVNKTVSVFHLDGMSSHAANDGVIKREKEETIRKSYPDYLEEFIQLNEQSRLANKPSFFTRFKLYIHSIGSSSHL